MTEVPARILVVDDEEALLRLMTGFLTRLGYRVSGCTTAQEARALFMADPHQFEVVVTDLSLPDGQGDELATEMLQLSPDLKIILCSGYVFSADAFPEATRHRVGILQKPFLPNMLASEIERALRT